MNARIRARSLRRRVLETAASKAETLNPKQAEEEQLHFFTFHAAIAAAAQLELRTPVSKQSGVYRVPGFVEDQGVP